MGFRELVLACNETKVMASLQRNEILLSFTSSYYLTKLPFFVWVSSKWLLLDCQLCSLAVCQVPSIYCFSHVFLSLRKYLIEQALLIIMVSLLLVLA